MDDHEAGEQGRGRGSDRCPGLGDGLGGVYIKLVYRYLRMNRV